MVSAARRSDSQLFDFFVLYVFREFVDIWVWAVALFRFVLFVFSFWLLYIHIYSDIYI